MILPVAPRQDRDGEFPLDIMEKAYGEGFLVPLVPREYGGGRFGGPRHLHHVRRAGLRRTWGSSSPFSSAPWPLYPIVMFGTEDQKETLSPALLPEFSTWHPTVSASPTWGRTRRPWKPPRPSTGDDYVLNGTKMWITNGGYANLYLVFATVDRQKKHKGIISLIVPAEHARHPPRRSRSTRWGSAPRTPRR